jgi:protein involved in polysaccharide export with SLBB domain
MSRWIRRSLTALLVLAVIAPAMTQMGCIRRGAVRTSRTPMARVRPATAPTRPATVPAATAPAPAAVTIRPATRPGTIEPGDLIVVEVPELTGVGSIVSKPMRVEADGTIHLLLINQPLQVRGLTTTEAQELISVGYRQANVLQSAAVYVRRLQLADTGPGLTGPIRNFDLLRVTVWDLGGPGLETVRIVRVGPDGQIGLPLIGRVQMTDRTASEAELAIQQALRDKHILQLAMVSVLRLEAAPSGQPDLPDAPSAPVPELLRPLYEPQPLTTATPGRK